MTCKDLEADIYLYSELSGAEQKRVDAHVHECKACRELFELAKATQVLTTHIGTVKPEPANHSRLTRNIMQAVELERQRKESRLGAFLNSLSLKYTMAAASLMLIFSFGFESFSAVEPITKRYPSARTVTLNSTSLTKTYRNRKAQPEKISFYACAKSGECNSLVESFKKKSL